MGKDVLQHNSEDLQSLLTKIDSGSLRIPSFQRNYVWKKKDVLRLLDSIFHEYPSGSLLLLNYNDETSSINFEIKSFYGSPSPIDKCSCLVLDGQQRLTSCYHVFYDRSKSYRYFIDLRKLYQQWSQFSGDTDLINFVDCIVTKGIKSKTNQVDGDLLPFSLIKTRESYSTQRAAYEDLIRDEEDKGYINFIRINLDSLLNPFLNYQFSTIELPQNLKASAVCRIFETLNGTGMKLDSFDICVARYMRDGLDLKSKIRVAKRQFSSLKVLFDNDKNRELVLQTIALSTGAKSHLKNKLVETLASDTIEDHWDEAILAIDESLTILDDVGVGTKSTLKLLPYPAIIPAISAAMIHAGYFNKMSVADKARINRNVQIFYYTSALTQRYTQGAASRMKEDYELLAKWFSNDICPEFIANGVKWLNSEMCKVSNKYNAVSCAIYSIINHNGPVDFYYSNKKISVIGNNTDLHHIFPKKTYGSRYAVDNVFNIAAITKGTNESINSNPTFVYADEAVREIFGGDKELFKKAVMSQLISSEGFDAFLNEDFNTFIQKRMESVIEALQNVGVKIKIASEEDLTEEEIDNLREEVSDEDILL